MEASNINLRLERSTFKYKEEGSGRGAERKDSQASVLIEIPENFHTLADGNYTQ